MDEKEDIESITNPVLNDLRFHLTHNVNAEEKLNGMAGVALPVAAIKSLLGVIKRSKANTMMGLQEELRKASSDMLEYAKESTNFALLGGRSHIALDSGCDLFLKYVTRCFLELPDFNDSRLAILERGERFANISVAARDRISEIGQGFVRDGHTVLTHGWSRVVASLLTKAALTKHFTVIVLEGRPDAAGAKAAKFYSQVGIPCTVVLDAAVGHVMERVDLVIVGAEGVVENGGIVNKIGTFGTAIAAKEMGKPFYVAAESYKFARLYPLNQADLPELGGGTASSHLKCIDTATCMDRQVKDVVLPNDVKIYNPPCDYTPAKYITLLFTDLGVLTPSAVSDELIRLYS